MKSRTFADACDMNMQTRSRHTLACFRDAQAYSNNTICRLFCSRHLQPGLTLHACHVCAHQRTCPKINNGRSTAFLNLCACASLQTTRAAAPAHAVLHPAAQTASNQKMQ